MVENKEKQAFAERFNQAMASARLKIKDLAKMREIREANISYEMMRRYSKGLAIPERNRLERLAKVLSVSSAWLFSGEGQPPTVGGHTTHIVEQNQKNTTYTFTSKADLLLELFNELFEEQQNKVFKDVVEMHQQNEKIIKAYLKNKKPS